MSNQETAIVYATDENEDEIPSKDRIEELLQQHFMDVDIVKLDLHPKKYFKTWVGDKRNAILVSGSFGRSFISELFRKSFINEIMEDHRLPVFIAHK